MWPFSFFNRRREARKEQILDVLAHGRWTSGREIGQATGLPRRSLVMILNAMEKDQIITGRGGATEDWVYRRHYRIDWPKDAT